MLPTNVRVSIGTAMALGLERGHLSVAPTTAYLMTFSNRYLRCTASCLFCPQSRSSSAPLDRLARVTWPVYEFEQVLHMLSAAYETAKILRVCLQVINTPGVFVEVSSIIKHLKSSSNIPISVSCQPFTPEQLLQLREFGLDRVAIPLDGITKDIFLKIKGEFCGGPYRWEEHWQTLKEAVTIFGRNQVSTHLIVGCGETEEQASQTIQNLHDLGVLPALFALTPIPATPMEHVPPPEVASYRRIQLARHLIVTDTTTASSFTYQDGVICDFGLDPDTLLRIVRSGIPFQTSGCPACNRPFYNESPRGPIYNFPYPPTQKEIHQIVKEMLDSNMVLKVS